MNHTPANWRVGDAGRTIFGPKSDQPSPATIAHIAESNRTTPEEKRANAALIVRAVNAHADLVAALQQIDSNAAESVEWIRRVARAAIAKAQG